MSDSNDYKVAVSDLLLKLSKIKTAIILKRKYLYENEIIELKNELNISYENAHEVIETVYGELFNNIYSDLFKIVQKISGHILKADYDPDDLYTLTKKEYLSIYRSNI